VLLVAALAVVLVLAAIPTWLMGALGPRLLAIFWWSPGLTDPVVVEARALALRPDSAIAPLEAGRGLFLLERLVTPSRLLGRPLVLAERPLPPPLPPFPRGWPGEPLNPRTPWGDAPDNARVLEQAVRGFTPAQVAWLRGFDAHPAWAAFHTIALAPAVDYHGARFRFPLPEGVTAGEVEEVDLGTYRQLHNLRWLALYNTSRAALRLADQRPAAAESILLETVSLGLRVADEQQESGVRIIEEGRRALNQFARLTGRTVPGLERSRGTVPVTTPDSDGQLAATAATYNSRASVVAEALDTRRLRSTRFELLGGLTILPCTNVRELVFGPDPDILRAFAAARRSLARFPSDSARIDALEQLATGARPLTRSETVNGRPRDVPLHLAFGRWVGHASARILGVPRIGVCFEFFLPELRFILF
jgi:hypothetical protein